MIDPTMARRDFVRRAAGTTAVFFGGLRKSAARDADLHLPSPPSERTLSKDFSQKGEMILQRVRPPLLETPLAVFDDGVFTPNDRFYVRWHLAGIPTEVDIDGFRLEVSGHVDQKLPLTLDALMKMPRIEMAAVNQGSGNSRGFVVPRVQWGHGAMGNAKWTGVRHRDVLDAAGIRAGATNVRFDGLDQGILPATPTSKSRCRSTTRATAM